MMIDEEGRRYCVWSVVDYSHMRVQVVEYSDGEIEFMVFDMRKTPDATYTSSESAAYISRDSHGSEGSAMLHGLEWARDNYYGTNEVR
ncbi:MAG: hypothetical protein RPU41_00645 [Candidatus Sedimenticola sp. (ex Thyasira tokunagai)]